MVVDTRSHFNQATLYDEGLNLGIYDPKLLGSGGQTLKHIQCKEALTFTVVKKEKNGLRM